MPEQAPIERAFFRETDDGATVYFPWGLTHRGYHLTDDGAKRKALRAASVLMTSVIGIGVWTAHALEPLLDPESGGRADVLSTLAVPMAALALVIAGYWCWVSRFVERFPESDLVVSREERLREAARVAEPWRITLIGVVTCGLSALLIWLQPHLWWLAVLGIALGLGTLLWASLLWRATADTSE